jgi:hypothetical protein
MCTVPGEVELLYRTNSVVGGLYYILILGFRCEPHRLEAWLQQAENWLADLHGSGACGSR